MVQSFPKFQNSAALQAALYYTRKRRLARVRAAAKPAFITLDATTKTAAGIVLSGGNLTASWAGGGGGDAAVFGPFSHSITSKSYFEALCTTPGGGDFGIGIALSTATGAGLGSNAAHGVIMFASGNMWVDTVTKGNKLNGAAISAGDVIGIAIDPAGKIWARSVTRSPTNWNDTGIGVSDPGAGTGSVAFVAGSFAPVVVFTSASAGAVTFNFGASAFGAAAPTGFGGLK